MWRSYFWKCIAIFIIFFFIWWLLITSWDIHENFTLAIMFVRKYIYQENFYVVQLFMHVKSLQPCLTLCCLMDCCPPGSSVHGISRKGHWSGLLCPPPGDLPDPGIEPISLMSPALAGGLFTTSTTWESPSIEQIGSQISCQVQNKFPLKPDSL